MSHDRFIYGKHTVQMALEKNPQQIRYVLLQRIQKGPGPKAIVAAAQQAGIAIQYADQKTLDQKTENANHQGVAALMVNQAAYQEADIPTLLSEAATPFVLILDGVQDPHNLGACLRVADGMGVTLVIAPKDKSVGLTPVVRKVACGAAETVPFIAVTNLARTLHLLKEQGVWLFGTSGCAEKNLHEADLTGPVGLVLGAEGKGMRRLTQELCDHVVKIPLLGSVESLNVSVATGICLFEAQRQRGFM